MGSSGGLKQDLDNYLSRSSTSGKSSGISLPTAALGKWFRKNEDEEAESFLGTSKVSSFFPTLTRFQRLIGFCICLSMSSICFVLAALYLPVLVFKARKFAMLFTLASLFFLSSFGFLWGPWIHLKHLFSREKLPFSLCYGSTLIGTLYCAMWLHSTPLTVLLAVMQVIALLWFLVSYIPGGQTGLSFFTRICTSAVSSSMSSSLPI
ncbi:protein transport protein SFT2-like isoform X1 [Diaphorina citri]|uniref:Vesicle transport protein n=2 Tax=Diaphorina citri TaxID=121845 RepID=A0A1S3D1F6_DIACI|nr:protein transport protein SFT2-like isoform X1 [Diaphorina citri]KAI5712619.1 hypothetical protein M8J75_009895 [Diaphorina citri]